MKPKNIEKPKKNKANAPEEYKHDQQYIKDNIKFIAVPFNQTKHDDKKMYDWIRNIADGKRTAYIKSLIRKDMEKDGE